MGISSTHETASALVGNATQIGESLSLAVDQTWLQGRSWYGGLQLALAGKAIRRVVGSDTPIRSVHATFLAPAMETEQAIAEARLLRAGRSVTQVQASIRQGDRTCFQCTAILGAARDSELNFNSDAASDADPEQSFRLRFTPGVTPNFIQHYDLRWSRGQPPFTGATNPNSTIFARPLAKDACYEESEFLAITDVIPPPIISMMRTPSPISTMNCALELIRPEAVYGTREWIRFEVEVHDAHSGYAWQTARMYAQNGVLLAVAHQSVAVFG